MADDDKNVDKDSSEESEPQKGEANQASIEKNNDELTDIKSDEESLDGEGGSTEIDLDAFIAEEDPEFAKGLEEITSSDFKELKINPADQADEVSENVKIPSVYRAYINNLPKEIKKRYYMATGVCALLLPIALLIYMGYLLPRFDLPFVVSMSEISSEYTEYPTDGVEVPLFDDFRSKSFTFALPKTTVNLKGDGSRPHYGEFEFFLNLRDKKLEETIKNHQSEILDLIHRALEEITLRELKSPMGKEKVKKILRYRINDHLQANHVLGVYYRSVLLSQ